MKTEEELKKQFFETLNGCFQAQNSNYPESVAYIYNPSYSFIQKINTLVGENYQAMVEKEITKQSYVFFEITKQYYLVDKMFWELVGKSLSLTFDDVKNLMDSWIFEIFNETKRIGWLEITSDDKYMKDLVIL